MQKDLLLMRITSYIIPNFAHIVQSCFMFTDWISGRTHGNRLNLWTIRLCFWAEISQYHSPAMIFWTGMHGCGKTHAAPAFDAAQHGNAWGPLLLTCRCCAQFFFFFFPQLALTRLKLGPNHTKSGWFALTRAVSAISGETTEKANSGIQIKKKRVQNTPFELNNKPWRA